MIVFCSLLLVACDSKPSFDDVISNFHTNRLSFEELAQQTCKLGEENKRFNYSPDKVGKENRNKKLDTLLKKIGAYGISHYESLSGGCSLVVGYYARGFGGSGISYNYSFQIDSITPYEEDKHTFEKISEADVRVKFDMLLNSEWYFTFKSS